MNDFVRQAKDIRTVARQEAKAIRDIGYDPDTTRRLVARTYLREREALDRLHAQFNIVERERIEAASQAIFGAEDLRGSAEPTAFNASYRDAQARAHELGDARAASVALRHALRSGDALLARAIGARAVDRQWTEVRRSYAETDPDWAHAVERIDDMDPQAGKGIIFGAHRPPELEHCTSSDISRLVDESSDLYNSVGEWTPTDLELTV